MVATSLGDNPLVLVTEDLKYTFQKSGFTDLFKLILFLNTLVLPPQIQEP